MISAPAHELPVLGTFGRYEVLGRVAWGGMAEIYLAREATRAGASRYVAIKRILPHVARDEKFLSMFLDEARLAVQLGHPHICHVYDFGELDGSWYIAMEWVHGATLAKTIKRSIEHGGIPTPIAVKIVSQVAGALSYVHRARGADGQPLHIVHRDVTPHNVMVGFEGTVKLLDFGIARARTQVVQTQEGIVKGKLAYMAPEQCRGEEIDQRADVFSLGVCLYEALVQRPLYQRKNEFHSLQAILDAPVPSIRDVRPDLPVELDAIVQKALQKRPDDRFRTAAAMHEALERWLAEERHVVSPDRIAEVMEALWQQQILSGPTVEPTPIVRPAVRVARMRRSRAPWIAVAILTASVAAALALWRWPASAGPGPEEATESVAVRGPRPEPESEPEAEPEAVSETEAEPEPEPEPATEIPTPEARGSRPARARRAKRPVAEAPAPPAAASGFLSINTRPWSRVYVGDALLGTTPIGRREVASGTLRVTLIDRDGQTHERTLRIDPGEHERAFFDLAVPP